MTKKNKWILCCMTSMLIGMLGVFFSSFQSIADKIAISLGVIQYTTYNTI